MLWLGTATAQRARKSQVAVAIALQSVTTKEASNACVNERCKILRSLNRVFVFEIVLCIGAPPQEPARFVDLAFSILRKKEAQEYKLSSQETNQNTGAAAPRTGTFEDKRRPNATDWIIRGGSSSTSRRTPGWIILGKRAARRPGLEHPGRNRQQEPPHPRHESGGTRGGQTPWTGASGAEQEGAATTTGAAERWFAAPGRSARGGSTSRGPHPPGCSVEGKVAARGE